MPHVVHVGGVAAVTGVWRDGPHPAAVLEVVVAAALKGGVQIVLVVGQDTVHTQAEREGGHVLVFCTVQAGDGDFVVAHVAVQCAGAVAQGRGAQVGGPVVLGHVGQAVARSCRGGVDDDGRTAHHSSITRELDHIGVAADGGAADNRRGAGVGARHGGVGGATAGGRGTAAVGPVRVGVGLDQGVHLGRAARSAPVDVAGVVTSHHAV